MFILIPLGGTGQRFKKNGYKKPKALINIFGKPILFWLLESLNLKNITTVCIPYNKEYSQYRFESLLCKNFPYINFTFIPLKNDTRGAAETTSIALKSIDLSDQPVLCLDSDNFYTIDIISQWNGSNKVFTFSDSSDRTLFSYISEKSDGTITDIAEKRKISNLACTGAYGF